MGRHTYICKYERLADFNLVVANYSQTAIFNSLPIFPAIRYVRICAYYNIVHIIHVISTYVGWQFLSEVG